VKLDASLVASLVVSPGAPAALAQRDHRGVQHDGKLWSITEETADSDRAAFTSELSSAQELLYATATNGLLVVLQGLDAAGKDGTIKHVLSGVNPQGCTVTSFKQPSTEELDHDFLWRAAKALPGRGHIGIFNRSHYEDVIVVRVHPELLPGATATKAAPAAPKFWSERYRSINTFEHHLARNGTRIVKFFLHLSKDEQKKRLLARLDDPSKHWKFSASDLAERQYWDDYQVAYEEALTATSNPWAPWYVIPADDKHVMRALVGGVLVHTIEQLQLALPPVEPATLTEIDAAKASLLAE
jgi:PPK2 family polyphosphate:nucleotide phosphotransferase